MTRQREPQRPPRPEMSSDEPELQLAQTLIALHRSERAPRAVLARVEARMAGWSEPRGGRAVWRRLELLFVQLAGWPGAGVVAVALLLLVSWQHQQAEAGLRQRAEVALRPAESPSKQLAATEVTVRGLAVPGSLQSRLSGDENGMGICEGHFLLTPEGAPHEEPIRVHWTRCDLPDALSAELQRVFSPVRGAPLLSVSVRGHWAGAKELDALGLRLQP